MWKYHIFTNNQMFDSSTRRPHRFLGALKSWGSKQSSLSKHFFVMSNRTGIPRKNCPKCVSWYFSILVIRTAQPGTEETSVAKATFPGELPTRLAYVHPGVSLFPFASTSSQAYHFSWVHKRDVFLFQLFFSFSYFKFVFFSLPELIATVQYNGPCPDKTHRNI